MTAAELLAECRSQGIRLQALDDGQLGVDAPEELLTRALVEALRLHKGELLAMLADGSEDPAEDPHGDSNAAHPVIGSQNLTEGDAAHRPERIDGLPVAGSDDDDGGAPVARQNLAAVRPSPAAPVPIQWPAAAAEFCLLLAPGDLPPVPFKLNGWTTIQDTGRFLRCLQADIERGPGGPRAFYGALQGELIELHRFALQCIKAGDLMTRRLTSDYATTSSGCSISTSSNSSSWSS